MKVGIIVFSQTGNTLSVAERLQKQLTGEGHSAQLERVVPLNEKPTVNGKIELKEIPDTSGYEGIVFASPVQAFSLAAVMREYLNQVSELKGKKVACFVTQSFSKPWLGGNRAIAKMRKLCSVKGSEVCQTGIVNWSHKDRQQMIDNIVANFSTIF